MHIHILPVRLSAQFDIERAPLLVPVRTRPTVPYSTHAQTDTTHASSHTQALKCTTLPNER